MMLRVKRVVRIRLRVKVGEIRSVEIHVSLMRDIELRVVQQCLRKGFVLSIRLVRISDTWVESSGKTRDPRSKVELRKIRAK
jgi:hypothetical protein